MLAKLEERAGKLLAHAEIDGVLAAAASQDMPGRYLKKGELVGHVLERNALIVRVVVAQSDIDLVRAYFRSAELRLADEVGTRHAASLVRTPAGGVEALPTAASRRCRRRRWASPEAAGFPPCRAIPTGSGPPSGCSWSIWPCPPRSPRRRSANACMCASGMAGSRSPGRASGVCGSSC